MSRHHAIPSTSVATTIYKNEDTVNIASHSEMTLGLPQNPCTLWNSSPDERLLALCRCERCKTVDQNLPWNTYVATPTGLICAACNDADTQTN